MRETLINYIQDKLQMEVGSAVHFKRMAYNFYLNGITPVSLVSIGRPFKDGYICYCIESDGYAHVVEAEKVHVNKLDTKAAKLLYLKE